MDVQLSYRLLAVWRRNMLVYRRFAWSNVVSGFVEPLLFLMGMGFGVGQFVDELQGVGYATFIGPGIIASSAMFASSFENTFGSYIRMVFQKTFDAIIATPVSIDEVVAGELLYGATKSTVSGTTILLALWVFGIVPGFTPLMLVVPAVAFLTGLLFAAVALTVASTVPNIDNVNYYVTLGLTPMFIFSGIFFPVESLPAAAQTVAWFTPLMHAVRLCRELVLARPAHILADVVWLTVVTLILLPWPLLLMRRKLIR